MPTRAELMAIVLALFNQWVDTPDSLWIAIYRLLLDYEHDVPRITDSNRLRQGIWRSRAVQVEQLLAEALKCEPKDVRTKINVLMRDHYAGDVQRMNPVGIAFACGVVYAMQRFGPSTYQWRLESRIGTDIFSNLTDFRRQRVDIAAFRDGVPAIVISSKWGIRHDRIRDPQEEADTYKKEVPNLKFFVVTNEFDDARLQQLIRYPTIDGVFHPRRSLVLQLYGATASPTLSKLKDLTELISL